MKGVVEDWWYFGTHRWRMVAWNRESWKRVYAGFFYFLIALGHKKVGSAAASGQITLSGIPNCLNYSEIFGIYTIYKCGRGPHNTTWWTADWTPMVYVKPRFAVVCNVYYYYYYYY
jgi:hypothetical protein